MYKDFKSLISNLNKKEPITVVVAAAEDDHALGAIKKAMNHGIMRPILVGDEKKIRKLMKEIDFLDEVEIINVTDPADAAIRAVALVKAGRAKVLMKGLVNTAVFLRAVLKSEIGLRTDRLLSHLAGFEIPNQKKIIFLTDAALNILPSFEEKKQILSNGIEALHQLEIREPKVAILSANEIPSEKLISSTDAVKLVEIFAAPGLSKAIVEGPMALDVIESKEAAEHKGVESQVSGDVDLILVPNIDTGNALAKSFSHYAGGVMAGVLLGAQVPIVMNSRSDTAEGKYSSILLALALKKEN